MDELEAKFFLRLIIQREIDRCVDISECNYDRESKEDVQEATFLLRKLIEARDLLL